MVRKTYLPEQIINKLREAEILLNQGVTIAEASRKIGITEQTYYRWRRSEVVVNLSLNCSLSGTCDIQVGTWPVKMLTTASDVNQAA